MLFPVYGSLLYQPWQSVAIDLNAYAGETLTIEFEHYDCNTGYHGSYSYVSAAMRSPYDTVYYCKGADSVIIEGYPRFASYLWSNGDTTQNATIRNPSDGDIHTCTARSYNGCEAAFHYVLKGYVPQVGFTYASGGCNQVLFTDTSRSPAGDFVKWNWKFGDALKAPHDIAASQNPAYVFSDTGGYWVTLIAEDVFGCTDTSVQRVIAESGRGGGFSFSPPCLGQPIEFTDLSGGDITDYEWNFGDGNSSADKSPVHTYDTTGLYTVSLVTKDTLGCADTILRYLTVSLPPAASFSIADTLCERTDIPFANTSAGVVSFLWDFGDSTQSANENPVHKYVSSGNYTLRFVVADTNGCTDTTWKSVEIFPKPTAAFVANPVQISPTTLVTFTNQSQGETGWLWHFGDGNSSEEEHPAHTYPESREYEALLIVANEYTCTDTARFVFDIADDFTIPNVFTPNGDGLNDRFAVVTGIQFEQMEMLIMNRWGDIIFRSNDPIQGWDGTINGNKAATGTYLYHISLKLPDKEANVFYGIVTLLR